MYTLELIHISQKIQTHLPVEGTWVVTVSQACATTAVLIKDQRQLAVVNADAVSKGYTPLVHPLSVRVSVLELQVSLWDDERHRFTSSQV